MKNKVNKGAPSGFIISLIVHAGAFFLAGLFVVFTMLPEKPPEFEAPPSVARPIMKLKKPKVKIKKSAQPKPSSRIVAKVKTAKMPEIQIPDLVGTGEGLMGEMGAAGEFMDVPDISTTAFGSTESSGTDLVGTYWDLKYTKSGTWAPMTVYDWRSLYHEFVSSDDWDTSLFDRYYKGPRKLYTPTLLLRPGPSAMAPAAFGMPDDMCSGGLWIVYYKGKIVHKDGITFRFWVGVDDSMCIRIDGKIVVAASWIHPRSGDANRQEDMYTGLWRSNADKDATFIIGPSKATVGDWVTLEPGVSYEIEAVATDNPSQGAAFIVAVEEKGVEYPKNRQGAPILPIFKTEKLSHDFLDLIYRNLAENEVNCTNGPIFSDLNYEAITRKTAQTEEQPGSEEHLNSGQAVVDAHRGGTEMETWSMKDGTVFEARLLNYYQNEVSFENAEGNGLKIPTDQLSDESKSRITLLNPPKLDMSLCKDFDTVSFASGINDDCVRLPEARAFHGFSVKQVSAGAYNHVLEFEMYIIGTELNGPRKILLDKQSGKFVLNEENDRKFKFWSKRQVVYQDYGGSGIAARGEKYYGFLIVIRDERGEIIAVNNSHNWLSENYENLRKRYPINFLDKKCERVYPTQPRPGSY